MRNRRPVHGCRRFPAASVLLSAVLAITLAAPAFAQQDLDVPLPALHLPGGIGAPRHLDIRLPLHLVQLPDEGMTDVPAPHHHDPALKVGVRPFAIHARDMNGDAVSLEQYQGKVVLLDFWATWCPPCRPEIPNLVSLYQKYHRDGFEILGISLDKANARNDLVNFMKDHNMTWREIFDGKGWDGDVVREYGVQLVPTTILVGRSGLISAIDVNGSDLADAVRSAVRR